MKLLCLLYMADVGKAFWSWISFFILAYSSRSSVMYIESSTGSGQVRETSMPTWSCSSGILWKELLSILISKFFSAAVEFEPKLGATFRPLDFIWN